MGFEMATAIFSASAVAALGWLMVTVHNLSVTVAVILQRLESSTQKKGKAHASISRLAAE